MQPQDVSTELRQALEDRWHQRGVQFRHSRFFDGADYWALCRRFNDGSAVTVTVANIHEERTLVASLEFRASSERPASGRRYARWPYDGDDGPKAVGSCLTTVEAWLRGYHASLEPPLFSRR